VTQSAPPVMSIVKPIFCAAIELSLSKWKLAFSNGERERLVTINAGDWAAMDKEIAKARVKLGVEESTKLVTCYEAGRDGFWIHRQLIEFDIENLVVDPSSILVPRRARRRKTDSLDALGLVEQLVRHLRGDKKVWGIVRVPTIEEEDSRRPHRERERLVKERTGHITRVKSLLALHGMQADNVRRLDGQLEKLPPALRAEVVRELERLKLIDSQLKLVTANSAEAQNIDASAAKKIELLERIKAIGPTTSRVLVTELFSWRDFKNGKQVGSFAGLTPTPNDSGKVEKEQGISKAGNRRVRTLCVEIAWVWLRYQPESTLAKWFNARFVSGGPRSRRLGIVALARKLLVALWRYLEEGLVPEGAVLKT
jgi:transposase